MHTRHRDGITVRPLRDGDVVTVAVVVDALGDGSRARRFGGAKPRLSDGELGTLARVDASHHVLVAFRDGRPVGLAQLVREGDAAEVAFAVADAHQGCGVGRLLAQLLADDARAAGIVRLTATVRGDNRPAISLLRSLGSRLEVRWCGGERELVAAL